MASFDTAIGRCGLAWRKRLIVGVQLPEAGGEGAGRLRRRFPDLEEGEPPPAVAAAIARIAAHLAGRADALADLALDWDGIGPFDRAVYEEARAVPAGSTTTYGALAARLGDPTLARAVGQALGRNPWPIVIPCHRVLGAHGRMGGFSAPGGAATKRRLLEREGALSAGALPLFGG